MRALLICPSRKLGGELQAALAPQSVQLVRWLEHYPTEGELVRLLRTQSPQAILLSVEDLGAAVGVAKLVESHASRVPILALGPAGSPEVLLEMMRSGVREFLQSPFEEEVVRAAIFRVRESAQRPPSAADFTDYVFSFLPSKAGVGTTTIAVNIAIALSRLPNAKALLADFDLNSGLVGFMLKLDSQHSVVSAAENAFRLDENLWGKVVSSSGSLDVLPSGRIEPGFRIEPPQIRSLLDFLRRHYKAICFDLSGNLEKYSIEIMHESKTIFLVCTAELPSLHLAREKLGYLRSLELEDRIQIILNRTAKQDIVSSAEVERLLGLPARIVFPNDYKGVHRAVASGKPVGAESELGRRFHSEAEAMLSGKRPASGGKRHFVEYFSLVPARYSMLPPGSGPSA